MKSKLQKLQRETSPPKSGKSKRIHQGFSMRKEIPKSGQRPTCQGCQQIIEYKDECIHNKYRKMHELQYTIDQYHCGIQCLGKMTSSHLRSFMEKKWREPFVAIVITELYKLFK